MAGETAYQREVREALEMHRQRKEAWQRASAQQQENSGQQQQMPQAFPISTNTEGGRGSGMEQLQDGFRQLCGVVQGLQGLLMTQIHDREYAVHEAHRVLGFDQLPLQLRRAEEERQSYQPTQGPEG